MIEVRFEFKLDLNFWVKSPNKKKKKKKIEFNIK